ncbi:hypothetical protein Tco_1296728 [Tanacetum coccineum]
MSETPPAEKDSTSGTTAARPRPDTAKRSLHTDLSLESKKKRGTETFNMEENNIQVEQFQHFDKSIVQVKLLCFVFVQDE